MRQRGRSSASAAPCILRHIAELPFMLDFLLRAPKDLAAGLPDPVQAARRPDGLCGLARDLSVTTLMEAYARGLYPKAYAGPLKWWAPAERMVVDPGNAETPKSVRGQLSRRALGRDLRPRLRCRRRRLRKGRGDLLAPVLDEPESQACLFGAARRRFRPLLRSPRQRRRRWWQAVSASPSAASSSAKARSAKFAIGVTSGSPCSIAISPSGALQCTTRKRKSSTVSVSHRWRAKPIRSGSSPCSAAGGSVAGAPIRASAGRGCRQSGPKFRRALPFHTA